jgi:predicted kinase
MHGLAETDRPAGRTRRALYAAEARRATYERLAALADDITGAGYSVVLDAAFLARGERDLVRTLARERGLGFLTVAVSAEQATLEQRITERSIIGRDPSDAGLDVLHAQMASYDPLAPDELADSIAVRTDRPLDPADLAGMIGRRIMEDSDRTR